ncbi:Aprataxin and PNK-like factor [Geodia barretti]|uniref:Aprataxin and PNK-like factor n=1 Tax=Geodia barretti TaxID=519541 RepID=A0AA35R750_GEOBA|nr:Aprataxin and PNK-like factor [Geodia barretti]
MARLVGQDSDVVLELESGETVLGRGPLLKIVDKRVSRSHATLEWENGILRLCPKHSNPCFLRPEGRSEFTTLVRDEWVELHHGNQISLLPDSLQYSVELETSQRERAGSQEQKERQREESRERETNEEREGSEKEEDAGPEREVKVATGMSQEKAANQHEQELYGGDDVSSVSAAVEGERRSAAAGTGRRRILPSWLSGGVATSSKTTASSRGSSRKTAGSGSRTVSGETSGSKTGSEPCGGSSSNKAPVRRKRKLSPSPDDEETSPSAAQATVTRDSVPQSVGGSPESGGPATPLPPCPYGAACYRKNPAHFQEFSHGRVDDRPHCPYGNACYRKNPEHRNQFQHSGPPAEGAAATKRARQTRRKRNSTEGVMSVLAGGSDDSDGPNTYDYNDSFIDDKELSGGSTSYGGESEDSDWAPPTQGGAEEEEVGDLVDEAKGFISNKKMWQP